MKTVIKLLKWGILGILALLLVLGVGLLALKVFGGLFVATLVGDLVSMLGFDSFTVFFASLGTFFFILVAYWKLFRFRNLKRALQFVCVIMVSYCACKVYLHNRPTTISHPEAVKWFDSTTGAPLLNYSKESTNKISLFRPSGFNPYTGEPLKPVTPQIRKEFEVVKELNKPITVTNTVVKTVIKTITNTVTETKTTTNIVNIANIVNKTVMVPVMVSVPESQDLLWHEVKTYSVTDVIGKRTLYAEGSRITESNIKDELTSHLKHELSTQYRAFEIVSVTYEPYSQKFLLPNGTYNDQGIPKASYVDCEGLKLVAKITHLKI